MSKLHILQHSLGLDKYGQGIGYRNYFATGPGSKDFDLCQELTQEGLMKDHGKREVWGNDHVFTVTCSGMDYIKENSPEPPSQPKLTRSQKRYEEYLKSGYDSFYDFIGAGVEIEYSYYSNEYRYKNRFKGVVGRWAKTKKEAKLSYKAKMKEARP